MELTMSSDRAEFRATIAVAVATSFLTPFMGSSINIALPAIAREFNLDSRSLSWVATTYLLTASVFLIPFGKWADLFGRKRVFLFGTLVYSLTSLASSIAISGTMLIVLRAVQGIGAAMIFATGMAILTSVTPPEKRGRILGLNVASVYLGLSVGPSLGGVLTQQFGWRSLFIVNFAIGMLIIGLVLTRLRNDQRSGGPHLFDWFGSALYSGCFVLLMYGLSNLPALGATLAVAFGLAALPMFVSHELKTGQPVLDIGLFRNNFAYSMSNLAALINYNATAAVTFLLSLYLQTVLGMSPQAAGLVLVVQPAVMALLSPLAGSLSDRLEPGRVASLGMALIAFALVLFAFFADSGSVRFVLFNLALLGTGFALFSSPNTNAVMSSVEKRDYGIASATLGTMRLTGQTLSMVIVMLIFGLKLKSGGVGAQPEQFLFSMRLAFGVFAVLCVFGIFASLARGRIRHVQ